MMHETGGRKQDADGHRRKQEADAGSMRQLDGSKKQLGTGSSRKMKGEADEEATTGNRKQEGAGGRRMQQVGEGGNMGQVTKSRRLEKQEAADVRSMKQGTADRKKDAGECGSREQKEEGSRIQQEVEAGSRNHETGEEAGTLLGVLAPLVLTNDGHVEDQGWRWTLEHSHLGLVRCWQVKWE
jgi:hypothetical protein